ncbi:hypothetical protein [Neisseria meningitidis]|uniref:hypothetical protein n=1 Tax=Neisseria meningitidis TaxID=487 RepID=UPI00161B9ED7|nr:hypothetical protein [Neisseria meningitidis]
MPSEGLGLLKKREGFPRLTGMGVQTALPAAGLYSGLTKTSTALPRLSSKRTIL